MIQTQPTIQQQHPNIQNQYNQFQQSQSYNLPPKPNQEVQGQNDFQHLPFNNQNAGQYGMNKRYPQMVSCEIEVTYDFVTVVLFVINSNNSFYSPFKT